MKSVQFQDILYTLVQDILYTFDAEIARQGVHWGAFQETNVNEGRLRFVVKAASRDRSITELCLEFKISRARGHSKAP